MANVELKDHFFVLQTRKIPVNGDLSNVIVELCHQLSIVDTETGQVLGESQGEGILNVGTPTELDIDFPLFSQYLEYIKIALVTKGMQIITARQAPPPIEETPTPE